MRKSDLDLLAEYYQYELSYLRSAGAHFASKFPKIAED
jgi:type VI protein secretion system component VasA